MDSLILTGLQARCLLGVYPEERQHPQPVKIDLKLDIDTGRAALSDHLTDTIDYKALTDSVCAHVKQQSFQLIEALAQSIVQFIFSHYAVKAVEIRLEKPQVLANVECISIVLSRTKEEFLLFNPRP